jgi:hypothetical protein
MNAIANHMRITGLQVTNEDVDTRKSAVADLVTAWTKLKDAEVIMFKAAEIAQALGGEGAPPATLGQEIEGTVQVHASSFLHSERPLEIGIVAAVAAIELMSAAPGSNGWTVADILATALWLACLTNCRYVPSPLPVRISLLRSVPAGNQWAKS